MRRYSVFVLFAMFCWFQVAAPCAGQTALAETPVDSLTIPETNEGLPGAGPIRRYEWFQNLWRDRRGKWAGEVQQDQGALVMLGDSITQGWGEVLEQELPGVQTANRGISGDTTRGMLIRLDDDVLELNPSGVVMLMGTNDLDEGATPEVIAGNVHLIIDRLGEHNPDMPVVLCLVMPSSAKKNRPADKIRRLNRLLQEAVQDNQQITVLDTYTLFANEAGDAKPEEFPDLLHPNDSGYAKWAAALRPVLRQLGFDVRMPAEQPAASTDSQR